MLFVTAGLRSFRLGSSYPLPLDVVRLWRVAPRAHVRIRCSHDRVPGSDDERFRLDLKPYFGDLSLMTSLPVTSPLASPLRGASHLECTYTGETVESEALHGLSPAGKPYFARYDIEAIRPGFQPAALVGRRADLWRYEEVLPVRDRACQVSLGEGWTPLLDAPRLAARMGAGRVWIKDEGPEPHRELQGPRALLGRFSRQGAGCD